MKALTIAEFDRLLEKSMKILDCRNPDVFAEGFIPESINIAYGDDFINRVKVIFLPDEAFVIVAADADIQKIISELKHADYSNVKGFLSSGYETWKLAGKACDLVISIDADEMALDVKFGKIEMLDLRKADDFKEVHVEKSKNLPYEDLWDQWETLIDNDTYYVYSDNDYNTMTAISFVKMHGKHNFYFISGGFKAITKAGIPLVEKMTNKK
jgi:hydroxyacylglutathione hydrolase